MSDATKQPIAAAGGGSTRPHSPLLTARALVRRLRGSRGESPRNTPRIRFVTPSRVAWGEAVTVAADYPAERECVFVLRYAGQMARLTAARSDDNTLAFRLPTVPASAEGISASIRAELFLTAGAATSEPMFLQILNGPVVRRAMPSGENEWRLEGSGFGSDPDRARVVLAGGRPARILELTPTEIRFAAEIIRRVPARVVIADRPSNTLQIQGRRRGPAL